ncbi:ABC transporter permease [Schinkia azotoformans]|uniref:ABC transporter permease n=1 Tax=Schinkia azotoformans TaxID=1454 RepID=UPI002E21D400|nr:ABC transporter permease [Schinkia azotoformans]
MGKVNIDTHVMTRVNPVQPSLIKLPGLKWLLLAIPLLYVVFLLYISIFNVLKLSIVDETGFTLEYMKEVLTGTLYLRVLWITVKISFLVTIFSLLIGYPVAYLITVTQSKVWKQVILGTVLTTLWISLLARTFSWQIILQEYGALNKLLIGLGMIDEPLQLLYNTAGVVIGMTHILLPYMILSLYSVMESIDRRLLQAAQGLGAKPLKAFFQIFLPLSLPGITAGSLIVFVLGLGYFITPAILGGQSNIVIAKLIQENIQMSLNWHLASALSLLLLVTTLLLLGLAYGVTKLSPMLKGVK